MKNIAILGSTGSIGTNTLNIVRHLKKQFNVQALAAHTNIDALESQALEFSPKLIAVYDEHKALELQKRLPHVEVVAGMEGLKAVATYADAELIVSAIAGTIGLIPTFEAVKAKKTVGLANKEALVSGGALLMQLAKQNGVEILPIDSEHSAIFQCLRGESPKEVRRLIITASGGPFRLYSNEELEKVTLQQALKHPTWTMGAKVTIDSSTLMNKGLEVIEARWLFDILIEQIDVVVHPQSIIHSMVEFIDGSIMAQMGEPQMIVPIQLALTYPTRERGMLQPFDFFKHHTLQFFKPDTEKFACLRLAYQALQNEKGMPCYLNAANEVLVDRFLNGEIGWKEISKRLEQLLHRYRGVEPQSIDTILEIDRLARQEAARV